MFGIILIVLITVAVLYKMGHIGNTNQPAPEVTSTSETAQEVVEVVAAEPTLGDDIVKVAVVAGVSYVAIAVVSIIVFFVIVLIISSKH